MSQDSSRLEHLKKALYSKKSPDIISRPVVDLREKNYDVSSAWAQTPERATPPPPRKSNLFIVLLAVAIVFFISAVVFAAFMFIRGGNTVSSDNVVIGLGGPVQIGGGEELSLDITVTNNNPARLEVVDLLVEYPDGTKVVGDLSKPLKRERMNLGTITPSSAVKKTVKAVLFGEENSTQAIDVTVDYRVPNSNAIYEKKKTFEVFLSSAPVSVQVDGVDQMSSGQSTDLKVTLTSNSTSPVKDFVLRAEYPFGFKYQSSDIKPSSGDNVWSFGTIKPQEKKSFTINGTLQGQDGEERIFRFSGGSADQNNLNDIATVVVAKTKTIVINKPFIGTQISFDGAPSGDTYAAFPGKTIRVTIDFINNTLEKITNPSIELKITGSSLQKKSITTENGFYDSTRDTIRWTGETNDNLKELAPGASGKVMMSFASLGIGEGIGSYKKPQIDLSVSVKGKQSGTGNISQAVESNTSASVKIASDLALSSSAVYSVGPFRNAGPLPPKVGSKTTYTVMWAVTNGSNDVNNAQVVATLPSYIDWLGVTSPSTERISFDPTSRQVTWNIGFVPAGAGFSSSKREAYFQIGFTPSLTQVGGTQTLLSASALSGLDTFTSTSLADTAQNLTTRIFNDPAFSTGQDNVVQ